MHGFHVVVLLVAGGGVRDTQCGFKVTSPALPCLKPGIPSKFLRHLDLALQGCSGLPATCCANMLCAQLFSRRAAQLLYPNQRLQRWCFDVELIYLAQRLGIPIAETSVNWTEIPGDTFLPKGQNPHVAGGPCATFLCMYLIRRQLPHWVVCCTAGSKVSITSILHMTWEMAAIVIGYSWWQCWAVHTLEDCGKHT